MMSNILIVDDNKAFCRSLLLLLEQHGHTGAEANNGEEALQLLGEDHFDVVVSDLRMAPMNGLDLLKAGRVQSPSSEFILVTAYGTIESAVAAMKVGAYDYLNKPFDEAEFLALIDKALEKGALRSEVERLGQLVDQQYGFEGIVAKSAAMQQVIHQARTAALTDNTVLLVGESGTGKDLLARAIHANSQRRNGPLVVVNSASLASGLEDSELFGHVKGAFTGADQNTLGLVAAANHGTLFLDEVADLSLSSQAKLLRCLESGEVRSVGATRVQNVNVRFIAATNRNLRQAMQEGRFREDLFYRLAVVLISIPPLRQRPEDIPPLVFKLLQNHAAEPGRETIQILPAAVEVLSRYNWPGNVRELDSCLRQAALLATHGAIDQSALPYAILTQAELAESARGDLTLNEVEKHYIFEVLQRCGGDRKQAQHILGISRATLQRRLQKYGVGPTDNFAP
jgi:DNA-binding NtrC family response regulator